MSAKKSYTNKKKPFLNSSKKTKTDKNGSRKAALSLIFGIICLWNGLGAALFAALIPIMRFAILKMKEMPSGYAAAYILSYLIWAVIAAVVSLASGAGALIFRKGHLKEMKKDTKASKIGRMLGIIGMGISGIAVITAVIMNAV